MLTRVKIGLPLSQLTAGQFTFGIRMQPNPRQKRFVIIQSCQRSVQADTLVCQLLLAMLQSRELAVPLASPALLQPAPQLDTTIALKLRFGETSLDFLAVSL